MIRLCKWGLALLVFGSYFNYLNLIFVFIYNTGVTYYCPPFIIVSTILVEWKALWRRMGFLQVSLNT